MKMLKIIVSIVLGFCTTNIWANQESEFVPDQHTVALWHLNGSGDDASGNGNHLAVKTDRVSWVAGKFGHCAEMGDDPWSGGCFSSDGGALTASGSGCTYPGSGDWTIEAWVLFPSNSAGYYAVSHYSKHWAGHDPYHLGVANGEAFFLLEDSSNNAIYITADISAYVGQWVHLAGVYRYQQDSVLYVNGVQVASEATTLVIEYLPGYDVFVGGSYCGTSTGLKVDEVRISNVARYPEPAEGWIDLSVECFTPGIEVRAGDRRIRGLALASDESKLYASYWTDSWSDPVAAYSTTGCPLPLLNTMSYGRCHGGVAVSCDGRYVYTPSYYQGNVSRFDLYNQNSRDALSAGSWPNGIGISPDCSKLVALSGCDGRSYDMNNDAVYIYDISNGNFSTLVVVPLDDEPQHIRPAFSTDSKYVYIATYRRKSSQARLYEVSLTHCNVTRTLEFPVPSNWLSSVTSNGENLFVSDTENSRVWVVDTESWSVIDYIELSFAPWEIGMHPGGRHLFVLRGPWDGQPANHISVFDVDTKALVGDIDGIHDTPADIVFTQDGRTAYVAHYNLTEGGITTLSISGEPEPECTASFQGLSDLSGGNFYSQATGISADGLVVVGFSSSSLAQKEAFRWTSSEGMQPLGDLPGGGFESMARAVSADGTVIIGWGQSSTSAEEAFRWTQETGMVGLGQLLGHPHSVAVGVSTDGSQVVGYGQTMGVGWGTQAFLWTLTNPVTGEGIMGPPLEDLPEDGIYSSAYSFSSDGSTIVGEHGNRGVGGYGLEACYWRKDSGGQYRVHGLGVCGVSHAATYDGSIIVGGFFGNAGLEVFRWTEATGIVGLGDLDGGSFHSSADDITADGSVIVGLSNSADGDEAFIWDENHGMRSLKDVLASYELDLTGWTLRRAYGISDDGLTIVGWGINPDGNTEAWLARLCEPVPANTAPVADAGDDQEVSTGPDGTVDVILDCSGLNDPDSDELTYCWKWTGGEECDATGVNPTIELPCGTYIIELIVNDGIVDSEPDYVEVTVLDGTPPVITCPPDLTLECPADTSNENTGLATATDNCDDDPAITYGDALSEACPQVIERTWTATDESGNSSTCVQTITVVDTTPPIITCPPNVTLECPADTSPGATGQATASDTCGSVTITYNDVSVPSCGNTETITRTWTATDECGNSSSCVQTITVVDTMPPEFEFSVTPTVLWPPNHKMVQITPAWTVSDNCDESPDVMLISITMNEGDETNTYDPSYDDTEGDGHTTDDIQVGPDGSIYLRAERSGTGNDRVYTITYRAVDECGNRAESSATVTVPHDQR